MRFTAIAERIGLWLLPRLMGGVIRYLETGLSAVQAADAMIDANKRRDQAFGDLTYVFPLVPISVIRVSIEACLVLYRLGITRDAMDQTAELVTSPSIHMIQSGEQRLVILHKLAAILPDMPERCCRLLITLAEAKLGISIS